MRRLTAKIYQTKILLQTAENPLLATTSVYKGFLMKCVKLDHYEQNEILIFLKILICLNQIQTNSSILKFLCF